MEQVKTKIKKFTDLEAWKSAHDLTLSIYKITKLYPREEQFGVISQMRRAAVSIGSNIAEGFSRNSLRDKSQFYAIAKGSLTELENQLLVSKDIGYLSENEFGPIQSKVDKTGRLLTGLIKYARANL